MLCRAWTADEHIQLSDAWVAAVVKALHTAFALLSVIAIGQDSKFRPFLTRLRQLAKDSIQKLTVLTWAAKFMDNADACQFEDECRQVSRLASLLCRRV